MSAFRQKNADIYMIKHDISRFLTHQSVKHELRFISEASILVFGHNQTQHRLCLLVIRIRQTSVVRTRHGPRRSRWLPACVWTITVIQQKVCFHLMTVTYPSIRVRQSHPFKHYINPSTSKSV